MIAVREPPDDLRHPPPSVVLPVVILEGEVQMVQLRESRQDREHLVLEEEVQEARAVNPIRVVGRGPHVNFER